MKDMVRMNWLIVLLGIALLGGGYAAARSYAGFKKEIRAAVKCQAIVDRLLQRGYLIQAAMQLQECAGATVAVRNWDALLSDSTVKINRELASADVRTRVMARAVLEHMARWEPQSSPIAYGLPAGRSDTEIATQEILAQALADASPGR